MKKLFLCAKIKLVFYTLGRDFNIDSWHSLMKGVGKMKRFWHEGDYISQFYQTDNIILHFVQRGTASGKKIIIGSDRFMSINSRCVITRVKPRMAKLGYTSKFNENDTVIDMYFTFECDGLEAAAKDLAEYIGLNELGEDILLIGHSKSGVCFYDAIKYIAPYYLRSDIKLITISAPFGGTIMAGKAFKKVPKKFNILINLMHRLLFKNHATDIDISPRSEFLKALPMEEDVLEMCMHYNICSTLEEKSFAKCKGVQEKLCKFIEWATGIDDGFVRLESQIVRPEKFMFNFSEGVVHCGHINSLSAGIDLFISGKLDF